MSCGNPNPMFSQPNTSDIPTQVESADYKPSSNIGGGTSHSILRGLWPPGFVLGGFMLLPFELPGVLGWNSSLRHTMAFLSTLQYVCSVHHPYQILKIVFAFCFCLNSWTFLQL